MPDPVSENTPPAPFAQIKLPEAFNFVMKISPAPALVKLIPPNAATFVKEPVT